MVVLFFFYNILVWLIYKYIVIVKSRNLRGKIEILPLILRVKWVFHRDFYFFFFFFSLSFSLSLLQSHLSLSCRLSPLPPLSSSGTLSLPLHLSLVLSIPATSLSLSLSRVLYLSFLLLTLGSPMIDNRLLARTGREDGQPLRLPPPACRSMGS